MNKFSILLKETRRGKTIARTLFNWEIGQAVKNIGGTIIDFGGGFKPSYERFWNIKPKELIRVDISKKSEPDVVANLNKPLPFSDNYADAAFLFSVVYILKDPTKTLREINRILKPGGKFFMTSPFIFNEAREPDDFWRFTSQGIKTLLKDSDFKNCIIKPVGERFSAAIYLISPFLLFWPVKFIFYYLAIIFDKLIPKKLKLKQPSPIGYFVEAIKQ